MQLLDTGMLLDFLLTGILILLLLFHMEQRHLLGLIL